MEYIAREYIRITPPRIVFNAMPCHGFAIVRNNKQRFVA